MVCKNLNFPFLVLFSKIILILKKALDVPGLFRISAKSGDIDEYKQKFDSSM